MRTALFIGRFQPLHRGHVHAIMSALERYDCLTIAIGSINKRDKKNPYSYSKRKSMLREALLGYEDRVRIIGIRDTTDAKWVKKIKKIKCDAIISGNDYVWRLLGEEKLEKPDFLKPKTYNGTRIREKLSRGLPVSNLVPQAITKMLERK